MNTKTKMNATLQRYVLIGAGLGLYFGYFFRFPRDPNFAYVLVLALFVTFVMFVVRLLGLVSAFQRFKFFQLYRMTFGEILRQVPINFLQYGAILGALEARHVVHAAGGRVGTIVFMTVLGTFAGVWYWWRSPDKK
ncbi:MAG: hypothetical protein AAF902_24795 [Chloroflexota bacterium]